MSIYFETSKKNRISIKLRFQQIAYIEFVSNQLKIEVYQNPFKEIKKTTVLLMVVGFLLSVTAATVSAGNGGIYTDGGPNVNSNFWHITHFN